ACPTTASSVLVRSNRAERAVARSYIEPPPFEPPTDAFEPHGNKLDASSVSQRSTQEASPVAEPDEQGSPASNERAAADGRSEAERSRRFQQLALPHLDA